MIDYPTIIWASCILKMYLRFNKIKVKSDQKGAVQNTEAYTWWRGKTFRTFSFSFRKSICFNCRECFRQKGTRQKYFLKKDFRKILVIVHFQNFHVAAATIIGAIVMHAAFLTFVTSFFNQAPCNRFTHTFLDVNGSA
jgi:hypothetical protein